MSATQALRHYDDQGTFGQIAHYLPAYDAGGLDQIVEEYSRLRSDNSRGRCCRSIAYSLQQSGCLARGFAVRYQAAVEFCRYLDLRVEAEAEQAS